MTAMRFVSGEPVIFLTHKERERAWTELVRQACPQKLRHPYLGFTVASFRRGGNFFDIDNPAKLALDCVAQTPESIWVKMNEGTRPGLEFGEQEPPVPAKVEVSIYIALPRRRSVKPLVPMSEVAALSQLGLMDEPLGLHLAFDSETEDIGRFDFEGPIKPLIDGLGPILGNAVQGPADYRIHDLRITKGHNPARSGVTVSAWRLRPPCA